MTDKEQLIADMRELRDMVQKKQDVRSRSIKKAELMLPTKSSKAELSRRSKKIDRLILKFMRWKNVESWLSKQIDALEKGKKKV